MIRCSGRWASRVHLGSLSLTLVLGLACWQRLTVPVHVLRLHAVQKRASLAAIQQQAFLLWTGCFVRPQRNKAYSVSSKQGADLFFRKPRELDRASSVGPCTTASPIPQPVPRHPSLARHRQRSWREIRDAESSRLCVVRAGWTQHRLPSFLSCRPLRSGCWDAQAVSPPRLQGARLEAPCSSQACIENTGRFNRAGVAPMDIDSAVGGQQALSIASPFRA